MQLLDLPSKDVPIKKKIRKPDILNELKAEKKVSFVKIKIVNLFHQFEFDSFPVAQLMQMAVYSTAEAYNLESLAAEFQHKWPFRELDIAEDIEDNVIPYEAGDERNGFKRVFFFRCVSRFVSLKTRFNYNFLMMFSFREGTIACWNMSGEEITRLLDFIQPFEIKPYERKSVLEEKEEMDFQLTDGKAKLFKGILHLKKDSPDNLLEQYAFSNAIALSVKLAVLESSLSSYIDDIQFITEDMKNGSRLRLTRDQVFRKTGNLFALRHHINLSSDLLDTPDFYWDRQDLEQLFQNTCNFLNINKRTKVMNDKLNHCTELMALLSHHLNDKHHVRLEWMIIVLIMVEVYYLVIFFAITACLNLFLNFIQINPNILSYRSDLKCCIT